MSCTGKFAVSRSWENDTPIKSIKLNKLTEYHSNKEREVNCTINDFTISRLDLCVNYTFPTQAIADTYLKLMKRGRWFKYLNEITRYSETGKRQAKYDNAVALEANSFNISIYSKKAQMLENINYYKEIPDKAEGLLRFEIQLGQSKVKYLMEKNLCDSIYDLLSQIPHITFSEFKRYMKGLFLKGDYITLHNAKERVVKAYPEHAAEIIEFLQLVSRLRSLDKALVEYDKQNIRCDKVLRKLEKLHINPVTLPEEDSINLQRALLPNVSCVLGL